jgi:hypothetical protein
MQLATDMTLRQWLQYQIDALDAAEGEKAKDAVKVPTEFKVGDKVNVPAEVVTVGRKALVLSLPNIGNWWIEVDNLAAMVRRAQPDAIAQAVAEERVVRATKLVKGCVVQMKAESGLPGYGNPQCVSSVCEPLGTIVLYGHNQHYRSYDVEKVLEYPLIEKGGDA